MSGFALRGLGQDGTDPNEILNLVGINTTGSITPTVSDVTAPFSDAYQQAQSAVASWAASFSPVNPTLGSSTPSLNISAQDLQNYFTGTAGPDVVQAVDSALATLNLPFGTCAGPGCGTSSSSGSGSSSGLSQNQLFQLVQQSLGITGKVITQVTLPAGQIQITGPNGQSETIQTNQNTAGFGIPGLTNIGGTSSWLVPAGILAAIIAIVSWGHK